MLRPLYASELRLQDRVFFVHQGFDHNSHLIPEGTMGTIVRICPHVVIVNIDAPAFTIVCLSDALGSHRWKTNTVACLALATRDGKDFYVHRIPKLVIPGQKDTGYRFHP